MAVDLTQVRNAAAGVIMTIASPVNAAGVWAERQPHMRAALEHLRAARAELEVASHDKGGYKRAALKAIDQAIEHVREGIKYANTH